MADSSSAPADETTLYEGEERVNTVSVGDTRLVVTTHRLLVKPDEEPSGRRSVDRTNLGAVEVRSRSKRAYSWSGLQWGLLGLFLLAAWLVVPFESFVRPVEQPSEGGFDGLFEAVQTLVELLTLLDELFLLAGVLTLIWAGVRFAQYIRSREQLLEIEVHGADPVRLPVPESDATIRQLRELLATASSSDR